MEWRDEGLVIGVRRHGERSMIIEAMTRVHGRHLGLVRGGRSARMAAALQPGNTLGLVWRARLDEHLGAFAVEPMQLRAGRLMGSALALSGLAWLGALARLLPERDPHEAVYETLTLIADRLDDSALAPALVARFEARILAECGFRLDLSRCAATGALDDLAYVSPKSGRAVSLAAGEAWRDRLLPLPAFLRDGARLEARPSADDIADGFLTTGFFLLRDVFAARGEPLPDSRRAFLAAAAKAAVGP
ncbi:DNA repair protein RecO [Roseiarcus sp.]|uniref:DNA repair protein RecO n=1 Tax=Roseiarcus sp. TaxID=1969460 RepID=UPI003F95BDA9